MCHNILRDSISDWIPAVLCIVGALMWASGKIAERWKQKAIHVSQPTPNLDQPIEVPEAPSEPSQSAVASLEIAPCGGEDVSLELRPSADGNYYGYGWIDGPSVTRQQSFDLVWKDCVGTRCHIRSGDIKVIEIADLSQSNVFSRGLRVHGDGGYVHTDESLAERLYRSEPTDWYRLHVEIRSDRYDESWKHEYRFRVVDKDQFEIEEASKS